MDSKEMEIPLLAGEYWWGGLVDDGIIMPFSQSDFTRDLSINLSSNQGTPLLISNKGRYIWSEEPYRFEFSANVLNIQYHNGRQNSPIELVEGHGNLPGAFKQASSKHFPATGNHPDPLLFTMPQYNTWIEMMYDLNQDRLIAYAESILENGLPPGVIIIDDNWQEDQGVWCFHNGRFPDPGAMVKRLHELNFRVMIWISPFISPDNVTFRFMRDKGYCLNDKNGEPAIRKWWNGYSAILDCTNEAAVDWFHIQLNNLMTDFGIDGFKFDAGDPDFYQEDDKSNKPATPNDHCEAWSKIGIRYGFNEYRACWKNAGQPLGQRLKDKYHTWDNQGLASLIPNGLAQGLMGYAFICPDMIGGGDIMSFNDANFNLDQELFVRFAQCSALFPMMQFSKLPWRVLDHNHSTYCIEAAKLHQNLGEEILEITRHAAQTGEPIIRHLAYVYPDKGYETITDQFMLGEAILVCPVLTKGAIERTIVFPPGIWCGDDGSVVHGPLTESIKAPLSRLPWYRLDWTAK